MITTYVLVLFAHVGIMGDGNSNSLTTANFASKEKCEVALKSAVSLSSGSTKIIKGFCTPK